MRKPQGFTLIELLVVIAIIGILMSLLFPAVNGAINAAKKAQAKNDATQLVIAVQAFYTEYGKYPLKWAWSEDDWTYDSGNPNSTLIQMLSANGTEATNNPRGIVFLETKTAKKKGANWVNGLDPDGIFRDPWGGQYFIRVDCDYDGKVRDPYITTGTMRKSVTAWSPGPDQKFDYNQSETSSNNKDNVTSW